jgi:hypothetical protein
MKVFNKVICLYILLLSHNIFSKEKDIQTSDTNQIHLLTTSKTYTPIQDKTNSTLEKIWGRKSDNMLYFEMFTIHVNPSSFKNDNWNQQLIGIQYNGFLATTLINSFYNRTYMLGISRTVFEKKYTNWDVEAGYDLGVIYGYTHGQAPFASLTPVIPGIIPFISASYKKTFGAQFNLVPDPAFSFFLRF